MISALPVTIQAQMFSIDDDEKAGTNPFAPYIRAGIKTIDFSYQGSPTSPLADELNLSGLAAHLSFESGGLNVGASLANKITGVNDQNYFDLDVNFTNPFPLFLNQNFMAGIPLQLASKFTSVRNDQTNTEFAQTNLSAGAGAFFIVHFPELLGASVQFLPTYGFSSSSGGFIGGNVFSLKGKARLNFYDLILNKNLSLGYDYNYDSYDIDGEEHDYDFTGHTLTIGISF